LLDGSLKQFRRKKSRLPCQQEELETKVRTVRFNLITAFIRGPKRRMNPSAQTGREEIRINEITLLRVALLTSGDPRKRFWYKSKNNYCECCGEDRGGGLGGQVPMSGSQGAAVGRPEL